MPIDPSIALGVKPAQLESPINQMAKMYEMQNAVQSNQLNQMKMDEYKRKLTEDEAVKNYFANTKRNDPNFAQGLYGISPKTGQAFEKFQAETGKEKALTEKAQLEGQVAKQGFNDQALRNLSFNTSNENIIAWGQDGVLKGHYTPQEASQITTQLLSIPENQRKAFLSSQGAKPSDLMTKPSNLAILQNELAALSFNDPKRAALEAAIKKESTYADTAMQEYEAAKATGFKGSFFDFKRQLAEAGRTPAQAPAPTITTVVDPTNPSRSLQVDARVYRGGGEGSAGVIGAGIKEPVVGVNLSAKTIQQREAKYPQATTALKGHLADTDNLVKDLTALVNHPGLSEITGIVAGRLPGGSKNARAAQALYDKIVAKGGFNELQKMRDNSVTGGALGNVSDTEGKRLEASFAGLDRRQDADSVKLAAKAAINQLNASKANIQDAYDLTYEYKGATGAPPPPPGFVVK